VGNERVSKPSLFGCQFLRFNCSTAQRFFCLSLDWFFVNGQTAIDNSPRINATAANCFGPTGPHFVVMKTKLWSGIRRRKPARTRNITALMINELGSIRVPPGIRSQE